MIAIQLINKNLIRLEKNQKFIEKSDKVELWEKCKNEQFNNYFWNRIAVYTNEKVLNKF